MSGGVPLPPPPLPVHVPTTEPPSHEVVVDAHPHHHSSEVTVHLSDGQALVYLEGAGAGRMVPEAPERTVRKSAETVE